MRRFAIILLLAVLAAAAVLFVYRSPLFHASKAVPPHHYTEHKRARVATAEETVAPPPKGTNAPAEGFYIGEGDQRVFIRYGSSDPLLRSLLQSVMDGSSDPNAQGKQIFGRICAACHQSQGEGKDGVAPPLVGSEWVLAPGGGRLLRVVLNGLNGPIRVSGKEWNLAMPPWGAILDDEQVAVVLTYIRTQLGEQHAGPITPEMVAAVRKEARTTPETVQSLLRIAEQ